MIEIGQMILIVTSRSYNNDLDLEKTICVLMTLKKTKHKPLMIEVDLRSDFDLKVLEGTNQSKRSNILFLIYIHITKNRKFFFYLLKSFCSIL